MKKTLYIIAAALIALCSCTKQEMPEKAVSNGEMQKIYARVNIGTKLAFTDNNPGISTVWEADDSFKAIQDGTTIVTFTLDSGEGTTEGIFSTTAEGVTESTRWQAVLGSAATEESNELHCGFMGQDGTLAGLKQYTYAHGFSTGTEPSFNFDDGKLAYILRVKLPAGVKCIEYTPCGWYKVSDTGGVETQYLNTSEENDYGASKTSTITLSSVSAANDFVYIAIPCLDYSRTYQTYNGNKQNGNLRTGVIITLLNNTSANANASNGTVFEQNVSSEAKVTTLDLSGMTLYRRALLSEAINYSKSSEQTISWSSGIKQKASSVNTYWSPFNVGSSSNTDPGIYFAFGDLTETRTVYSFVNYEMRHKTDGTNNRNDVLSNQRYGGSNTTFYSVVGSRYDIARVKWGVDWRMPYSIEIFTLWNGGSTASVTGGVNHTCSANSKTLFIPNSGVKAHKDDGTNKYTTEYDSNNTPRFWTGDKNQRSASNGGWDEAETYGTALGYATGDYWRRPEYIGMPIRPVHASSTVAFVN